MASFGETLKRERELRDISLRQISESTKISIRYLEALEQNRFELLPGGLFNKGFIRAYSSYVGLDSESMVNSYLHQIASSGAMPNAGSDRPQPALHRPAEVPQRRAAQRPESSASAGSATASVIAPPSQATRAGAPSPAAPVPAVGRAPAVAAAPAQDPGVDRVSLARTISGIETVDRTAASSRALLWIFSLVAGAGVVFLVLTLATGRSPQSTASPAVSPGPATETAPESDPGDAAATGEAEPSEPPPRAESRDAAAPAIASVGGRRAEIPTPPEARMARDEGRAAEEEDEPSRDEDEPRAVPMELQVEAATSAWVQIACDGQQVVDGMMRPGETLTTQCLSVIRVSATDAGAVSLSINGAPCLPLGEPGTRAYGYTIRGDDFRRICPPSGRGADGRP